ncbi:putative membrane protein YuiD [Drosera capensis]
MTVADASSIAGSADESSMILPLNFPLISAILAFALGQFLKLFTLWFKEKRWDSKRMLGSGGMPSSHSATVTALVAAIGIQEGTGGSAFALAAVLSCIVVYDASGVRLHAGVGRLNFVLRLLNQIVCELPPEHPVSSVKPIRDSLGHTPLQRSALDILEAKPNSCTDKDNAPDFPAAPAVVGITTLINTLARATMLTLPALLLAHPAMASDPGMMTVMATCMRVVLKAMTVMRSVIAIITLGGSAENRDHCLRLRFEYGQRPVTTDDAHTNLVGTKEMGKRKPNTVKY